MVEQSYIFDFHRSPRFFYEWNNSFKVVDMQSTTANFQIVYCSQAPTNIEDCLVNNSTLDTNAVTILQSVDVNLVFNDGVISVGADATWNIGDTVQDLKAVFIRHKNTGFVMGYSINTVAFEVTNKIKLEKDTILWSIVDG